MNKRYYSLKEKDFAQEIEPYIATHYKWPGCPAGISHYAFFCAALYVLRKGVNWRDVTVCYGKWHAIYTCFALGCLTVP